MPRIQILALHHLTNRRNCRVLFFAWFVMLFILSSIPGHQDPQRNVIFADKIAHVVYFSIGSTFFMLTLSQSSLPPRSQLHLFISCILMTSAVGIYDEWHQTFTPNRDGNSLGDIFANVTGGALGYLAGWLLIRRQIYPHASPCKQRMTI